MPNVGAVVLAAGMAKRMGFPKILLPVNGKPLFRFAVETAVGAKLHPIVLVSGEHTKEVKEGLVDLPLVRVIANTDFTSGMASSLQIGIRALKDETDAAVIFLADQPFVSQVVLTKLLQIYESEHSKGISVVRPQYHGVDGHPIIFDACLYEEFERISGDEGGRSILKRCPDQVRTIAFDNPLWGMDVDTPEDLMHIKTACEKHF